MILILCISIIVLLLSWALLNSLPVSVHTASGEFTTGLDRALGVSFTLNHANHTKTY